MNTPVESWDGLTMKFRTPSTTSRIDRNAHTKSKMDDFKLELLHVKHQDKHHKAHDGRGIFEVVAEILDHCTNLLTANLTKVSDLWKVAIQSLICSLFRWR